MNLSFRWVAVFLLLPILLMAGCTKVQSEPSTTVGVSIPQALPSLSISAISTVPEKCHSVHVTGLPVDEVLMNTHILFPAWPEEGSPRQLWVYSIKDNSQKLLFDDFSSIHYDAAGFLKDGFHFILARPGEFWLSDLNGSPLRLMNEADPDYQTILDLIPIYSRVWQVFYDKDETDSPDGTKSAIWLVGDPHLVIMDNLTGEKFNVIEYNHIGYIAGNWSPDGSIYAFTFSIGFNGEPSKLYFVNSNGTDLREMAEFEKIQLDRPYWSPDGQKIIFAATGINRRPTYFNVFSVQTGDIGTFPVDAELSLLSRSGHDIDWSPDSQWALFFTEEYISDQWRYSINVLNIATGEYYCIPNEKGLIEVNADWR